MTHRALICAAIFVATACSNETETENAAADAETPVTDAADQPDPDAADQPDPDAAPPTADLGTEPEPDGPTGTDSTVTADVGTVPEADAATEPEVDAAATRDQGPEGDAGVPPPPPVPAAVALSAAGPDQLQSAAAAPDGKFYAVGFAAAGIAPAPRTVVVVRLTAEGTLDPEFSDEGIATTNLEFRGGNDELDIVVQPSGKIVISATVANAVNPLDTDVAVSCLNADGTLDVNFGEGGVRILDLATGLPDGDAVTANDRARGLAVDADGRLYVHAISLGLGDFDGLPRTDTDFTVVRLGADGAVDEDFATDGVFRLDLRGAPPARTPSDATARGLRVLADGSVLASGYATTEGLGDSAQPVLFKLDADGAPAEAFAAGGVFHETVLSVQTEIYNFAVHGDHAVTAGYGRESGDQNDWVSMRFDVNTGVRDPNWGGAAAGAVVFDPSGAMVGDNCRNAIALPEGRTMLIGSTGPNNVPEQNAVFAVLDANGMLDAAFGGVPQVFPLGAEPGGNDQFWGGAVSGENVLIVGYKGGGPADQQTDVNNDDAYALIVPLP